jgi:hypothetical protein
MGFLFGLIIARSFDVVLCEVIAARKISQTVPRSRVLRNGDSGGLARQAWRHSQTWLPALRKKCATATSYNCNKKLTILWRVHPLDRALRHVCRPQARFGRRDCLVRRPFFFSAIGFDPATRPTHFRTRLGSRESVTILRYEVSASIGNTTASDIAAGPAWHRRSG